LPEVAADSASSHVAVVLTNRQNKQLIAVNGCSIQFLLLIQCFNAFGKDGITSPGQRFWPGQVGFDPV